MITRREIADSNAFYKLYIKNGDITILKIVNFFLLRFFSCLQLQYAL